LTGALVDQFGATVKQGRGHRYRRYVLRRARRPAAGFWKAHQDERGFATMHINHVRSGTPIAAILRPARTPKGTEVRTVVKHVSRRLRRHWPRTRLIWRGDSRYGRDEVMAWCDEGGKAFIFGLSGNSVLDAMVSETCDHLRFWHAVGTEEKLRCYTSLEYQARSWARARRVIARVLAPARSERAGLLHVA
jgi:hypothetical protein